jgi:hypothetical protein
MERPDLMTVPELSRGFKKFWVRMRIRLKLPPYNSQRGIPPPDALESGR